MSSKKSGRGSNPGNFGRTNYSYKNNLVRNIGPISGAIAILTPVVIDVLEWIKPILPVKPKTVIVPLLYNDEFTIKLNPAIERISSAGLQVTPIELSLKEAVAEYRKYKDCSDTQVVDTFPKQSRKVPAGSFITVKYITQAVIDECQRLFDESERQKAESNRIKTEKHAQRVDQAHTIITGTFDKAKDAAAKVFPHREKEYPSDDSK